MSQQAKLRVNDAFYGLLSDPNRYEILYGGSGCFTSEQKVITQSGSKPISSIKVGDYVLCYNHSEKKNEFRKVTNLHEYKQPTEKIYRVKLKDGTVIEATENHKFFYGGSYVKIKDILLSFAQ